MPGQSVTSVSATAQYDDLGRVISVNDPDKGTHTLTYDADSHVLTNVSGSRTIGTSYDLLGRVGCVQDAAPGFDVHGGCTSGAHPFVQNTYDADPSGVTWTGTNYAVGRLTQSIATTTLPDVLPARRQPGRAMAASSSATVWATIRSAMSSVVPPLRPPCRA
ncbi:hypothetical protein KSF_038330 [Reticulibacter mediterranei]|uniref:RHS repeat protein n=1 Tax=Reticulibacter mediterranei TaxID=2778369 RepID=A0A8J3IJS9_9CHLR|nr:RHS repeat domain-containing protein [Reticulibacter mediterranei]GHO93785.1 hypothetical protein KSF_038330 [Reticulibacter mediterranei]